MSGAKCFSNLPSTLSDKLYDFSALLGTPLTLSKAQRLAYRDGYANHAMLFTGVDMTRNGTVGKFIVESSNGGAAPSQHAMTTNWFREHVLYAVVDRHLLSPNVVASLSAKPVVLPEWDAMAKGASCSHCMHAHDGPHPRLDEAGGNSGKTS